MVSPPKPWERNPSGAAAATTTTALPPATPTTAAAGPAAPFPPTSTTSPPTVPDRPPSLASTSTAVSSPYAYGTTSPYSRVGGYGSYGSYSGLGSYGMGSYGGYSGLGSYGGYGGYGGYGSYGMGMGGPYGMNSPYNTGPYGTGPFNALQPLDANGNPLPTLTQTLESTTQHTFQLLHSIVQTFTGVAQMLESTFMATHSSFFAMVGVIDQFGQLRNALGSVLGLFGLVRWLRDVLAGRQSLTGGQTPNGMQHEFREFINGKPVQGPLGPPHSNRQQPRASKKPLYIFLLAIFGIPFAMSKLIKILQRRIQTQQQQQQQVQAAGGGQPPPPGGLDPSTLTFARALYPFSPSNATELALKENEVVAIMGKLDPRTGMEVDPRMEVDGEWWKGRTRDGREGWFPRKWVEVLQKKQQSDEPKKVD
ncbi:hypothetical protein AMATHDRAFT_147673 [Amanita thiersii Skay4041]|uniref:Peroxisomal membrane protein PEX13 n=1 Tax=Amanita thiersii Skay4041 TaxID=703135 RepID=A0A2A9NJF4_9AGAR|nr:hypothetical protein AMATHDRAFT_147673 [Amanita thiersii Skay4041]